MEDLLSIENLIIDFDLGDEFVTPVNDISFSVGRGEIVALVGESGSGKSVTSLAVMGLLAPNSRIRNGQIRYMGKRIDELAPQEKMKYRGNEIAMVFQEPMTSLDPLFTVGQQITEVLTLKNGMSAAAARKRAIELLELVGINQPEKRYASYPHELSGGMRQRVMIASAIACDPKLLIADEPTTALDVTIQKQILNLLLSLRDELGMAILLITHDLAIVSQYAERVVVMYASRLMEIGSVAEVIEHPKHFYTKGLLRSAPTYADSKEVPLYVIPGSIPLPTEPLNGCRFAPRCQEAAGRCFVQIPPARKFSNGSMAACWKATFDGENH